MKPLVQEAPPLTDVAQPVLSDPPLENRPVWKTETIVDPYANVSGSTWVLWYTSELVFVYGSSLTVVSGTFANATLASARTARIATDTAASRRSAHASRTRLSCIPHPPCRVGRAKRSEQLTMPGSRG